MAVEKMNEEPSVITAMKNSIFRKRHNTLENSLEYSKA